MIRKIFEAHIMMLFTLMMLVCSLNGVTAFSWNKFATCSQTCGGGYRYRFWKGQFKECNTNECPSLLPASCPKNHELMYGKSSCCKKLSESCGVTNVGSSKNINTTRKALVGQFPWAAAVVYLDSHEVHCSGSLIHKDWILTPAHCFYWYRNSFFYILLGITSISQQETSKQIFDIGKVIQHEKFAPRTFKNDVALVQLKKSATLNNFVKPICLPNGQKVNSGERCVFNEFDYPFDAPLSYRTDLIIGTVRNWPYEVCYKNARHYIKKKKLCFGGLSDSLYSCNVKSESGIICQSCSSCSWYIAGIPTFGLKDRCSVEVTTNVAYYEDWIRKQIAEKLPYRPTNTCDESCPANQIHKFDYKSTCCVKSKENCGVVSPKFQSRTRIIGGTKSKQLQWPWLAAIVNKTALTASCGGSLIHKDWVLTAAHCIVSMNKRKFHILLGSTSIRYPKATKQIIQIEKFIIHEHYFEAKNDIGLIKLKKSASYDSFVKPICLPRGEGITIDMKCVAAGWEIDTSTPSDDLQHVVLRSLSHDACRSGLKSPVSWKIDHYSNEENVCFEKLSGGKDTCSGDSGGPIMCQRCSSCGWYVAGITSYGPIRCGEVAGQPSVYVYVKAYESWIRQKVYGSTSFESVSC